MKKQSSVTNTVDQVKEAVRKQIDTIKSDGVSQQLEGINQMVSRVEERFGFSREDALRTMQNLFDTYGDEVLDLIAQKTSLPIKRKKQDRGRKLVALLTVAMAAMAVARWLLSRNESKS